MESCPLQELDSYGSLDSLERLSEAELLEILKSLEDTEGEAGNDLEEGSDFQVHCRAVALQTYGWHSHSGDTEYLDRSELLFYLTFFKDFFSFFFLNFVIAGKYNKNYF